MATVPSALSVVFSYAVRCLPADTACQTLAASTPLGATILGLLSTAFNAFVFTAPACQFIMGASAGTFNQTCLAATASTYCTSLFGASNNFTVARAATQAMLYNMTKCGTQPTYPDGTCLDPSTAATAATLAADVAASCYCGVMTTTTTTTAQPGVDASSSSGGGGGGGIGMFAGAAGGGIALIALIVLVVLWRRRKAKAKARTSKEREDRNVVAFENPMYDNDQAVPQLTYDTHEPDGLYDEPAFNPSKKANPLYNSRDELDKDHDEGARTSGYLDIQPHARTDGDDGYLDHGDAAAPDAGYLGAAEDTGYLGNAEDTGYLGADAAVPQRAVAPARPAYLDVMSPPGAAPATAAPATEAIYAHAEGEGEDYPIGGEDYPIGGEDYPIGGEDYPIEDYPLSQPVYAHADIGDAQDPATTAAGPVYAEVPAASEEYQVVGLPTQPAVHSTYGDGSAFQHTYGDGPAAGGSGVYGDHPVAASSGIYGDDPIFDAE